MKTQTLSLCRTALRCRGPQRAMVHRGAQFGIRWSSNATASEEGERQWSTPLAKSLAEAISVIGIPC